MHDERSALYFLPVFQVGGRKMKIFSNPDGLHSLKLERMRKQLDLEYSIKMFKKIIVPLKTDHSRGPESVFPDIVWDPIQPVLVLSSLSLLHLSSSMHLTLFLFSSPLTTILQYWNQRDITRKDAQIFVYSYPAIL